MAFIRRRRLSGREVLSVSLSLSLSHFRITLERGGKTSGRFGESTIGRLASVHKVAARGRMPLITSKKS